ncbi:MAG: hypothetical protein JXR88_10460 [Clostridia bacterium]|nr:hypothetical protein [Clostridia bacterium]
MNIRRKIGLSLALLSLFTGILMVLVTNVLSRSILKDRSESFLASILTENAYNLNLQMRAVEQVTTALLDDVQLTYNFQSNDDYREIYLSKIKTVVKIASELSPSKSAFLMFFDHKEDFVWYADINYNGVPEENFVNDRVDQYEKLDFSKGSIWYVDEIEKTVSYLSPLYNGDTLVAIVGNDMNFNMIEYRLNLSKYLSSGYLYLKDENGNVIYHPKSDLSRPGKMTTDEDFEIVADQGAVTGNHRLVNNWIVSLSIDSDEIYAGLDFLTLMTIIIILVSLIIVLIYSVMFSNRIGKPYVYLAEQVEDVGHGNYDIELDKDYFQRSDEIGILTRALDAMIQKQKESFQEIQQYNVNLEQKVQARTEELIEANDALEASFEEVEAQKSALMESNHKLAASLEEVEKTRKQLVESEKLASTRYLAIGIAHNLNTPVGNMLSVTSYIDNRIAELETKLNNNQLSKAFLTSFISNYKNASKSVTVSLETSKVLIDRLIGLSMINVGKNTVQIEMEDVINRQFEIAKLNHPEISSNLSLMIENNIAFNGDLDAFSQMIYELLDNAFIHGYQESELLMIQIVVYESKIEKDTIVIEFSDNGKGVTKDVLDEIFTPLYTSQLSSRHGLGLATVLNLITQQFNGTIEAHVNNGLTFIIQLKNKEV